MQQLRVGERDSVQLAAVPYDENSVPIAEKPIQWLSDAPSVASVSAYGLVRAVGLGTTAIKARCLEGPEERVSVEVVP